MGRRLSQRMGRQRRAGWLQREGSVRASSFQPMGDGGPPVEMEFGGKARLCALGLLGFGYQNICMAGKPKASRGASALGTGTGWDPREAASVEATSSLGESPRRSMGR